MGSRLVWEERYNIGVDVIDKEHRKLFGILNRLLTFSEQEDKSQWVCQEGIKYFKDHAMKHFSEEEVYMASIGYKGYGTHRRVHDNFRLNTLPALEKELKESNFSKDAVGHFLSVCTGWLVGHTLIEDRAITGKVMSTWGDLLPEEELIARKQLIIQLFQDMFQLNTKLISDRYGGEKFGNGIYYRLSYANKEKEKWDVILIFEEKLLMETVGKIMGGKSEKLNVMLMNIARYMSRQFVERVREHIPMLDDYDLNNESLLSYEQFQREFDKPQCSLLFDTGSGYFAYCVMAPDLVKKIDGETVIKTENEVAEVRKYLKNNVKKNAVDQRKKILLVDDSDTVRLAMQELLKEDYQITEARSGMSAIRSMTLDRPNLVLLDYEMPVCDGVQVLQMIRSEEEFADIPVFFLTSRVDKGSVTKVMPLKPEGYLLKSLKPEDIKKNIDGYFEKKQKRTGAV